MNHRAIALVADDIDLAVKAQLAISDPTRLRNPLQAPMYIDSIVIYNVFDESHLGDIQVRFRLGAEYLTNGYVPLLTFDRLPNTSLGLSESSIGAACYIWRFKKPLYVPANGYLVGELWNTGTTQNATYNDIVVTYRGRSLPRNFRPREVHLPWCASFIPPSIDLTTPADSKQQSKKTDLVNPFNVPFHVTRFNGSICHASKPSFFSTAKGIFLLDEQTTVRLTDSTGGIIVRDPTPLGHLCQILDASWQMNAIIKPRQFWIANMEFNYSALTFTTLFPIIQPFVAISGYRTLPINKVSLA